MATINKKIKIGNVYTHGGAPTKEVNAEEKLRRAVFSCLLWENSHYEDGISIADRIKELIPKVDPLIVATIAYEARNLMKLRHVPLLIAREMARIDSHKHLVGKLLPVIIQRPDELTELVALYWKEKKQPLSSQIKKGLAEAFKKFDEYSLAKYNKSGAVTLRDVLFLTRPKPKDKVQAKIWKKLVDKKLDIPDTWETNMSQKTDSKKEIWERLLKEKKLGDLALIRNLRNMSDTGVSNSLIVQALDNIKGDKVLPFRYLAAAKYAPKYEPQLEQALFRGIKNREKLPGKTILIVDVSGSMYGAKVSKKSEMDRAQAACSLAILVRELCENPVIYATAGDDYTRIHQTKLVPARRGFALSEAIYKMCHPLGGGGIFLKQVMDYIKSNEKEANRIIVITDEQDCDIKTSGDPNKANAFGIYNYIINVNTYENGIGYSKWTHINGWSEAILDYIKISEEGFKSKSNIQSIIGLNSPNQKTSKKVRKNAQGRTKTSRRRIRTSISRN